MKKKLPKLSPELKEVIRIVNAHTKEEVDIAVAQVVSAVTKTMASKEDIKNMATKDDIKRLDQKVDQIDEKVTHLQSDMTDVRRRVIDLEHDTPTQKEVDDLKKFVGFPKL